MVKIPYQPQLMQREQTQLSPAALQNMSSKPNDNKTGFDTSVHSILYLLEPLRPYSNAYVVVLLIRRKGWFKDQWEELDIETIKEDTDGREVNMYFECDDPNAPIPHQTYPGERSSMSLKSFLWKLDALPESAKEFQLESRTMLTEEATLDRTIIRIRSIPQPPKVFIELCSHEITWTNFDKLRIRLRNVFRFCVDILTGRKS